MRRLTTTDREDRGGATVFIIVAITAVMIGVGFAIDVGQYVAAVRSAQNTADATALAVATDCALTGAPNADYSPYRKPGQTISSPVCGSGEAAITATKDVDGLFLQQSAGDVDRTATARWGTIATANVLPIAISDCEFSQALLEGPSDIILYLDDPKPQSGCSSLPGGFSQIDGDGCAVAVSAGGTVPGQPGGALQKVVPCITNPNSPALPHDVLIPIYDAGACEAAGCNGQGPYLILGFAAFQVTGYSFNGISYAGSLGKKCPDNDRGRYCIRGDFVEYTTTQGTPGPSTNFGATQVYLYS
jgi:Flp pilus assembly protein TadG